MICEPEQIYWMPKEDRALTDLAEVFANHEAPLEVDIGCGNGAFLVAMAERFPERNFLGIEKLSGRVQKVCRKGARSRLANLRVIQAEISDTMQRLLPPGCATTLHVSFPDPWPKRRHHSRRIITAEFLAAAHKILIANGELRLVTDDFPYFQWMRAAVDECRDFTEAPWPEVADYPTTQFERRFIAEGVPIHRMFLRKV